VPTTSQLQTVLLAARRLERDGARARFGRASVGDLTAVPGFSTHTDWRPGLDFGGAAKGLALDRALARLRRGSGIEGAMISAGSSTAVWGRKSDGEPWRVGIEDPRATGTVVAVVNVDGTGTVNVSTSGDYQQFFERGGVRYHHILDPATGRPARGLRSLTVFGDLSGLDADILSTALFVMGRDRALSHAREHGLGLYLVDDAGTASQLSPRDGSIATLEILAAPQR
jgi:thiamine biosynthesis lipoprotein ApbE